MKNFILLVALLSLVTCSSSTSVGTGGDFSTFSTQPSGAEFARAIVDADYGSEVSPKRTAARAFQTLTRAASDSPSDKSGTRNCPGGGTVKWTSHSEVGSSTTQVTTHVTLAECSTTLTIDGQNYTETLSGSLSTTGEASGDPLTTSGVTKVGISGRGDIGFAVTCEVTTSYTAEALTWGGTCTFRDASGTTIETTGEEIFAVLL